MAAKKAKSTETPLMKQYYQIKGKYPDAILLFRVGDFYETFGEDAEKAASILGIVLTQRKNGAASSVALAGFPHHALDTYLPKLVKAGLRVAICDQLEDPKKTKTIVKRGVTELVTPGVTLNDKVLDQKQNNFLASVHLGGLKIGVSFLDISTGEFLLSQGDAQYVDKLIQSFQPSEVLVEKRYRDQFPELFGKNHNLFFLEDWAFNPEFAYDLLTECFRVKSLKGYGVENYGDGIIAAGAILQYLKDTHHHETQHLNGIARIDEAAYVWLDRFTIRNLEILQSNSPDGIGLIDILDHTVSSMGSRLLKRWLVLPLKDKNEIELRHAAVDFFKQQSEIKEQLRLDLKQISDLERLSAKIATKRVNPRELLQLSKSLGQLPKLIELLKESESKLINHLRAQLNPCTDLYQKINCTIQEDAPLLLSKGNVVKEGVNPELDELRNLANHGKDQLLAMQHREIENTGIPSLKIAFNNVFGYYIEVRNTHKDKVPENWIRKQTLVSAERYITEELKEFEQKILGAEDKIQVIEQQIYEELVSELLQYLDAIKLNAQIIGQLDVLSCFAHTAIINNYCKPSITNGTEIEIENGRHPVIEQALGDNEEYIPNSIRLDNSANQILMITGPNMSGKSAVLRQTALICLMAQAGSFVPAEALNLGVLDKIFSRVGASDNISSGESTFMVEMNETASILNNISDRSLILMDEIGRGTSTYDGISIAWSIAEFLHENPKAKAKTLFATHYHELNQMAKKFDRIKNFNVAIKEVDKKVLFLRKLVPGGSEHSFGIHVAKLAGMPNQVIKRAETVLKSLEKSHRETGKEKGASINIPDPEMQLSIFKLDDPVLEQIRDELLNLDINSLTPVEALMKLNEIQKWVGANAKK
ncbi:DNA mismatch repair protein MutS [Luteibaculum oceani]|uniref:DNA mismatch repair protein MutS n=1 Tax=Luteibaculum oceani TaxID=1294296 RepID=A0A5C6VAX2_9FLAO|nr:DNA mismatch repair protein MutS [Luteibaculum oceani]TXC81721.1 DNA mismatch repair protein MutS [Luteibaculum oceani]